MGSRGVDVRGVMLLQKTWRVVCGLHRVVLGKFGPGPIGTQSGLDQTQQSQSGSGIFPKTPDCLVSGLGNITWAKTVQTRSGPGPTTLYNCFNLFKFALIIQNKQFTYY